MFSKELRKKIILKFNIEECCINRPLHYRIPTTLDSNPYLIYNNLNEERFKKKIFKISRNITNYSRNKENNIQQIKTNLQRNKIDFIFNKTYDKINNNKYRNIDNINISNKKLQTISNFSKEKIKTDLINKNNFYNSLFKKEGHRNNNNYFLDKQFTWSKTLLEQKQIKKYKKIYKLKYIDTFSSIPKKIYNSHKYKRDITIPKIIKLNSYSNRLFNKKRKNITNIKYSFDKN